MKRQKGENMGDNTAEKKLRTGVKKVANKSKTNICRGKDKAKPEQEHNWKAIKNWLRAARRDLKRLETDVADPKKRSQMVLWQDMQLLMNSLAHAWTSRYATDEETANPTIGATYKKWMRLPAEFLWEAYGRSA
jgi:predicted phage gp36 major capsid-like protein